MIKEDYGSNDYNLSIRNQVEEIIGVIMLDEEKNPYSMYLCGANSTYYYVESTQLEDIQSGSFSAYNDEYEVELFDSTVVPEKKSVLATVEIYSESDNPDYEPFQADLYIDVNPTKELPF